MPFLTADMVKDEKEKEQVAEVLGRMQQVDKKKFWYVKRAIDITMALIALLVFSIPMLLITLIIFCMDPKDNPIFCQTRTGRHGKEFQLYKFRTMVPGADQMKESLLQANEMDGPVFKIKNDPRVTKFGRFLRKTSLDELPQFFNVLKGDMAVIGPRPPIPKEVKQYTKYQMIRLTVTPGITGLWQVQPNRNDLSFDEWVDLDIEYILHRSVAMDIKIMLRTAVVMLKGEGR